MVDTTIATPEQIELIASELLGMTVDEGKAPKEDLTETDLDKIVNEII